jgi:HAD superfamily hydrolase (TIGR01490 family)
LSALADHEPTSEPGAELQPRSERDSSPASARLAAAYCDVDGTLTDTTIVPPLIWMKQRLQHPVRSGLWLASLVVRAPWWMLLDRFSRSASNTAIYSNYRGVPADETRRLAELYYFERIKPKIFGQALEWIRSIQASGVRVVLVTGGLDLFMQPMARDLNADCVAPSLEVRNGLFTGGLTTEPLTGEKKSEALQRHALQHGVDLKQSYALGDAIGDIAMLEAVGHPVAVNPDPRLEEAAKKRGWRIERWKTR